VQCRAEPPPFCARCHSAATLCTAQSARQMTTDRGRLTFDVIRRQSDTTRPGFDHRPVYARFVQDNGALDRGCAGQWGTGQGVYQYFCFPVSVSFQQCSAITYLSLQLKTSLNNTPKQDNPSQPACCHFGGKWCRKYLEDFREVWRETWQQRVMAEFITCIETLRTRRKKFGFINCDFLRGFVEIC